MLQVFPMVRLSQSRLDSTILKVFGSVNRLLTSSIPASLSFRQAFHHSNSFLCLCNTLNVLTIDFFLQLPSIKLFQKSPQKIFYPFSQQVLWLEIRTKASSVVEAFDLKMNTPIDDYIALLSICQPRLLHVGSNVIGAERFEFLSHGHRVWHHHDQLVISLKKPLVNVRHKNVSTTDNDDDDLVRMSFVITSHINDVINKSVIHDNTKLFLKAYANLTSTLLWAGVALWTYSTDNNVSFCLTFLFFYV